MSMVLGYSFYLENQGWICLVLVSSSLGWLCLGLSVLPWTWMSVFFSQVRTFSAILSWKQHQANIWHSIIFVFEWVDGWINIGSNKLVLTRVLVSQSCLTLCYPVDWGPPGSSVRGLLQVRLLECVAISFSRGSSWPRDRTQVSCIAGRFFTVWATREAPQKPLTQNS